MLIPSFMLTPIAIMPRTAVYSESNNKNVAPVLESTSKNI
jgi:hypothetical protein